GAGAAVLERCAGSRAAAHSSAGRLPLAAVVAARRYDDATEEFHGFAASRRNYDVAQGIDADGWPQSGVLEPSWHVGGASSAELAKDGFHYGACRAAP